MIYFVFKIKLFQQQKKTQKKKKMNEEILEDRFKMRAINTIQHVNLFKEIQLFTNVFDNNDIVQFDQNETNEENKDNNNNNYVSYFINFINIIFYFFLNIDCIILK